VLVNCAGGYGRLATVEDMPLEEWDRTVALNLRSVFLCCRAAIPHLKRSKGRTHHQCLLDLRPRRDLGLLARVRRGRRPA
jgi:NAD(P)-dependent dehydrogenase (short-subunit alcohol dehydrogenase family)